MIRRIALFALVAGALCVGGAAAWAHWGAAVNAGAHGTALAASVNAANTPTASLVAAQRVTLTWPAVTLSNGVAVDGYVVKRYDATTLATQTVLAGCAGTITATTCTESPVPVGTWRYAVYPRIGINWLGTESSATPALTVTSPTLTLARTLFTSPLPIDTTGTVSGFGVNEAISYRLDAATALTGHPTVVDTTGGAPISALTIPAAAEGAHTVWVIGANGSSASTTITIDTLAPVPASAQSPAANGAGWNTTAPVTVTLSATDATSGVASIRYTTDGSDPTVSGTALTYSAPFTVAATATVRYYATDVAGNASAVSSRAIKIDTVAPTNAVALSSASGAILNGGTVYYNGTSPGSFALTNTVADANSGPASSSTAALSGTSTGFTHTPSTVSTPAGGPYVSGTFSWTAGTTTAPTETVTGADVAGNTTATTLSLANDSTGPAGGSVDAAGLTGTGSRYSTSTSISVAFAKGTDAGVGLTATGALLQRATATLTTGTCGSYGTYSTIATDPTTPYANTVTDQACYRYQYVVADLLGNTTTYVSGDVKVDTTAPTTPTLTPVAGTNTYVSGSTVYYNSLRSTGSFTVTASSTDAASGIASYTYPPLGTNWSGTAGAYSWSGTPAAPGTKTITATNNATLTATASLTLVDDTTAPAGGSVDATGLTGTGSRYSTSTSISVAFAKGTDTGVGLAATGTLLQRATATLTTGTCGSYGTYSTIATDPTTPYANTVTDQACYRYQYVVADLLGNTTTYVSGDVKVDTTAPSAPTLTPVAGTNTYVSGSTVYYNSTQSTGSFTVTASSTDAASGIASYTYPPLGTNWSGTAGAYSWSGTPAAPGTKTITATNNATLTATASLTLVDDVTAPSGGSVDAAGLTGTGNRYSTSTSISVAFAKGTDAGVGLTATGALLQRATATLTTGTCGSYGTYSTIATDPTTPYANTVTDQACYRYQYVVADLLGNTTTYVSGDVKVDTTAPSAPTLTPVAGTNTYVSGSTVYYNSTQSTGSFTVTASSTDAASGIASYTYPPFGTNWSGTAGAYSWSGTPAAPGTKTITATNNATLTATASLTLVDDVTAPAGGSVDAAGLTGTGSRYSTSTSISVAFAKGTDAGVGLAATGALLQRATATLTTGTCGSYGTYSTIATDPTTPHANTVTDQACYRYQYVVADLLGNTTTYVSGDVKVDTTAPTTPTLTPVAGTNTYVSGSTVYYNSLRSTGSFTVTASSTDAASGIASYTYPPLGTNWSGTAGAYSWSGTPAAPGTKTITATNNATLTATASLTLVDDVTAPAGGSISYTAGYLSSASRTVTFTAGTDGGSGLDAASAVLQRSTATMTGGVCGSYGAFTTIATAPTSPYTDTTMTNGTCFKYQYVTQDNVTNQTAYTGTNVVKMPLYLTCLAAVQAATPLEYFRLTEASGAVAADSSGNSHPGAYTNVSAYNTGVGPCGNGISFSNGSTGYMGTTFGVANPLTWSTEIWFKTTATGVRLIGFGNAQTGTSSSSDRHIYVNNSGNVVLGAFTGIATFQTVASPGTYNDGAWHQAVATMSAASGAFLYVDGAQVGANSGITVAQNYTGYWRVGTDNLQLWPGAPTIGNNNFAGSVSNASVYLSQLSATQVMDHYIAGYVSSSVALTASPPLGSVQPLAARTNSQPTVPTVPPKVKPAPLPVAPTVTAGPATSTPTPAPTSGSAPISPSAELSLSGSPAPSGSGVSPQPG